MEMARWRVSFRGSGSGGGARALPLVRARLPGSSSALDLMRELGHVVVDQRAFLHELGDLRDAVHDRSVVAPPELSGDSRVAQVGELAVNVHADLAGGNHSGGRAAPLP